MSLNVKRLKNLKMLVKDYPYQSTFEAEAGISKGYLSHICSGKRNMSGHFARKIETNLGIKSGSLDE